MQTGIKLSVSLLFLIPGAALAQSSASTSATVTDVSPLMLADTLPNVPAAPPLAVPPPPPPPPKWSGDFSAGFVRSSGNASASTLNLKFDLDWKSDPWENLLNGSAFKASSDGVNTDEKYDLGDKLSYNLDPNQYLFAQLNTDYDRYGPFVQRYSADLGYGRHILKTPTQTLDVDVGVGADHTREQGAGSFDTNLIGTVDANYLWKIGPNSQFKQTLRTEFAQNNTFVDPISELKLAIIQNFFATLDYELRYNTKTPAGTFHTDQIESVNIGYSFGKPAKAP